ncbi:DUF6907 domain-containing protein [Phytohabitans aurantiacus]|uniref:Uncharacterized protein n=1 Tax=Phytohabitans aurantiacus TaxID=3016789 RepID=A0ABQ5R340_9ACTN|nr:hypothetical protein [Phytohabitans aurantiacus]GLI00297.1 hypothetical protein Pa4123_55730 [Phytohabitans aurantiacus]
MEKVSNLGQSERARQDDLVEAAVRALISGHGLKLDRGQVDQLLSMWAHVDELTAESRERVLGVFGGPRLTTDIPCPDWCVRDHGKVYEDYTRECVSETAFVPTTNNDGQADDGALYVEAYQAIDLESQTVRPKLVSVGDTWVTPSTARRLADLIVRAADVAEGHTS